MHRLVSSEAGEALIAVRDNEIAARVIGVRVLRTKLLAFLVSSFVIGVAGALWAFAYLRTVEPAGFDLERSFQLLFIIIIGGLASIRGAFLGAALIVTTPILLSRLGSAVLGGRFDSGTLDLSQHVLLGVLILVFLIAEPKGLVALVDRAGARVSSPLRIHRTLNRSPSHAHRPKHLADHASRAARCRSPPSSARPARRPTSNTFRCRAIVSAPTRPVVPVSSAASSTTSS